jgi:hypothetical protein
MDGFMGAEQALGQVLFSTRATFSFQHSHKVLSQYKKLKLHQSISCILPLLYLSHVSDLVIKLIWLVDMACSINFSTIMRALEVFEWKSDSIPLHKRTSIRMVEKSLPAYTQKKVDNVPFRQKQVMFKNRSLLHLWFLRSTQTLYTPVILAIFLYTRNSSFKARQAVRSFEVCRLLGTTSRGGGSGGSTTLGTHSLAPVIMLVFLSLVHVIEGSGLHEGSREEGNTNHQSPARHDRETVNDPTERNTETSLSKNTVERVEESLVGSLFLLESLDGGHLDKVLSGDSGTVQRQVVDSSGRSGLIGKRLGKLDVDDAGSTGTPCIAQLRFLLAVQTTELGTSGDDRELGDGLGPLDISAITHAEASAVAAGGVDHPVLDAGAGSCGARLQDLVVVLLCQDGDSEFLCLAGGGVDGVGDARGGRGCC